MKSNTSNCFDSRRFHQRRLQSRQPSIPQHTKMLIDTKPPPLSVEHEGVVSKVEQSVARVHGPVVVGAQQRLVAQAVADVDAV